jgi:hypothetical protein
VARAFGLRFDYVRVPAQLPPTTDFILFSLKKIEFLAKS